MLQLNGVSSGPRLEIMAAVRDAIQSAGGWITGHQQFSNISVCLLFEIDAAHVPDLLARIAAAGVVLSHTAAPSRGEVRGSLQITFRHQEPDLRIPVPAVPS